MFFAFIFYQFEPSHADSSTVVYFRLGCEGVELILGPPVKSSYFSEEAVDEKRKTRWVRVLAVLLKGFQETALLSHTPHYFVTNIFFGPL